MTYRSQPKRLALFALLCAGLLPSLVAGCRSNAQQDLVARELRMQEDQLYAMEDYLTQYQKLVCKYRSENAALRRRLAEDGETTSPPRRATPRRSDGTTPADNGPSIEIPPRRNGSQPPPLEVPEVPSLEETTLDEDAPRSRASIGHAAFAAAETSRGNSTVQSAIAVERTDSGGGHSKVWLHGEVVENETGGGPRLVVEVWPLDRSGHPVDFAGKLSLMLLAPNADGSRQQLARWDYAAEEVQAAVDANGERAIRFFLELPADAPNLDRTQLWARLLPAAGPKMLAHVPVQLSEPGRFSSLPIDQLPLAKTEEQPIPAARPRVATSAPVIQSNLVDAGWTTARPGAPAGVADESDVSDGQWRASAEAMPVALAHGTPVRSKPQPRRAADQPIRPEVIVRAGDRETVGWSPDRPGGTSTEPARTATKSDRPRWSATR